MNGFILAAAMLMGQQCPGGSCAAPSRAQFITRGQQEFAPNSAWEAHAVRVVVDHGDSRSLGSGTIIGSGDGSRELVLTARHVIGNARNGISIRYRNDSYPARLLGSSNDGDVAALETNVPGDIRSLSIADTAPSRAMMLGYGSSGQLHAHRGSRVNSSPTPQGDSSPDHEYAFSAEQGDSGGGVIDADGRFAGVLWGTSGATSMVVSTAKVRKFLQCDERRGFALTPIGLFCWRGRTGNSNPPPVVVQQPPVQPQPFDPGPPNGGITVQVPGVGVQVGAQGPQGPPGKDGISPDLTALTAQVNSIAATQNQIITNLKTLATTVQNLQSQPGAQGPPGPAGPVGPAGAPGSTSANPGTTINLRFQTPTGTTPIRTFPPQIGADGKPFVNIEIDTTQLGSTTIPVTPLPPTTK